MGMSATQARYLALTAQQTNLEYQGQQINQERTILSQQVSDLYNNLLNMQVPTPPSTQDYTRVEYSGKVGATVYNFDATTIKPTGSDTYSVTVKQNSYGHSLQKNVGVGEVDTTTNAAITANQNIKVKTLSDPPKKVVPGEYFVKDNGVYRPAKQADAGNENLTWYQKDDTSSTTISMNAVTSPGKFNGHQLYSLDNSPSNYITAEEKSAYKEAIENSGITDLNGNPYTDSDFYFYLDDDDNAHFVLKADVEDGNTNGISYAYLANGNYDKSHQYKDCKLTFDSSNGRITELSIPNYDGGGNLVSYTSMKVEANSVTDELAYNEAMTQYKYQQYEYDKKQQEINAKTELIQQQDRNLELRLQRLDTQRTQITTEMDAIKKVLNDNIESSYKAFSG